MNTTAYQIKAEKRKHASTDAYPEGKNSPARERERETSGLANTAKNGILETPKMRRHASFVRDAFRIVLRY